MVCGYSGTQVATFLVLILGTTAIGVSLLTNYWEVRNSGVGLTGVSYHEGLLWRCLTAKSGPLATLGRALDQDDSACKFRYQSELDKVENTFESETGGEFGKRAGQIFEGTNVHKYEFATGVLIVSALFFGVFAIIVAPCCCHRCGCCQSLITLISAMCAASGVVIYCIGRQNGWKVDIGGIETVEFRETTHPFDGTYGWSFFVAIVGAILQFMASSMFCMGRGRAHAYSEQL